MNLYFINILPNLYWFYIETGKNSNENNNYISHQIKSFCKKKEINKIIRLDQDTSYWNKFNMYSVDIQKKVFDMETQKIKSYLSTKIAEIIQNYYNYQKTLILSNNHTDTAIILFIYLLRELCNMDYKQSLLSIQSKMNSKLIIQNINTKLLIKNDFTK